MKIDPSYYNIVDWDSFFRTNSVTADDLEEYLPFLESQKFNKRIDNINFMNVQITEEEFMNIFDKFSNKDNVKYLLLAQNWFESMSEEIQLFFQLREYNIPIMSLDFSVFGNGIARNLPIEIPDNIIRLEGNNYIRNIIYSFEGSITNKIYSRYHLRAVLHALVQLEDVSKEFMIENVDYYFQKEFKDENGIVEFMSKSNEELERIAIRSISEKHGTSKEKFFEAVRERVIGELPKVYSNALEVLSSSKLIKLKTKEEEEK